jgi:hypothetical protein
MKDFLLNSLINLVVGSPKDVISSIFSLPITQIIVLSFLFPIIGMYNSFLNLYNIDRLARFIVRHPIDFHSQINLNNFAKKAKNDIDEQLSALKFSHLEKLRFSVFKGLQSNPPFAHLRPDGWSFLLIGSWALLVSFLLISGGVFISLQPTFSTSLTGIQRIDIFAIFTLLSLLYFFPGRYSILRFYQCKKAVKIEKDTFFKINDDEISDLVQNRRMIINVPEEIFEKYQKLGLKGKFLNEFIIKTLEKDIQYHQDLAANEKNGDTNPLTFQPKPVDSGRQGEKLEA